jgi:hypothetical protein
VGDITTAVVLLLPGFLSYVMIYRHLNPGRLESEFTTTVKSMLWSVGIDAAVTLISLPAGPGTPVWLDPRTVLWQFAFAVGSGLLFGLLQRRYDVLGWVWRRLGLPDSTRPELFRSAFDFSTHGGGWVYVRLVSEELYYGALVYYTDDPRETVKELGLIDAYYLPNEAAQPAKLPGPVYLRLDEVAAVEIARLGDDSSPDGLWDFLQGPGPTQGAR